VLCCIVQNTGLQHNLAGLFILIADRGGDMELIYYACFTPSPSSCNPVVRSQSTLPRQIKKKKHMRCFINTKRTSVTVRLIKLV
jgi:hypothetical protein